MKKIFSKIGFLITLFLRFIDKKIILPITRFFVKLQKNIIKDGKSLEKILNKKNNLLFVSLLMALIVFIIIDTKSITMSETSAEVLYNQKINIQYNEEAYVLEGVPESVDITLIGRQLELYLAKQISDHEITLDLSGLKPGTHKVDLRYNRVLASLNYKLDPSIVTVTIHPKVSELKTINIDLLNKEELDQKLIIEKTETERDDVIIKGAEFTLEKVATVRALIDIKNLVEPEIGQMKIEDIPLRAYDENGNLVDVEIVPARINATLTIASPNKIVPIKVIPVGAVSFGKAISNIKLDVNEVTIYGEENILMNISHIPVEIDVGDLAKDKRYNVSINKPSGIRYMSAGITNIDVTIEDEISKEFEDINIEYENLGDNFKVNALTAKDRNVTVIVKGVESVIDKLDPKAIRAYVDLQGYGVGGHEVEVKVEKTDLRLVYIPKVSKIKLVISK